MKNIFQEEIEKRIVIANHNKEKNLTTYKYIHGGLDFSKGNIKLARGTTLDKDNNIVIRGMDKFFNYKQLENYNFYSENYKRQYADLNSGEEISVYEKLDGTMILLSTYNNEFVVATTSSTQSPFSVNAVNYFNNINKSKELFNFINDNNLTLVFEFVSYDNWIVVKYDYKEYILTQIIKNQVEEERLSRKEVEKIANLFDLEITKEYKMKLEDIKNYQLNNKDSEGFIAENEFGKLIKFKTNYWFENSNNYSKLFFAKSLKKSLIRKIIELNENDTIDDILAYNNQFVKNDLINLVNDLYNTIKADYKQLSEKYKGKTNKEIFLDNSLTQHEKTLLVNKFNSKTIEKIIQCKIKEREN